LARRPIRLLALDIDGTLLRSDKTLSSRTKDALDRARTGGVRVVLVTGRRYPSARPVADELGSGLPLVLHNGALVVEDEEVLRCRPLPRPAARSAILLGRAASADPVLHCGVRGEGRLLVERTARPSRMLAYYLERSRGDVLVVDDLLDAVAVEDPIQVMFSGSRGEMDTLVPLLANGLAGAARIERTVYPASGVVLLDVLAQGVGKAEALAFLQERWGIGPAETLAIGDNWNDREMVMAAGYGFVMGNADPELLALGLPALPTNDDDGVARAIEEYVLGIPSAFGA
jgi:Cof subfamily protein (haloacid dehalogenase superfamily)